MIVCKYDNFIENIFKNETIDLKKENKQVRVPYVHSLPNAGDWTH